MIKAVLVLALAILTLECQSQSDDGVKALVRKSDDSTSYVMFILNWTDSILCVTTSPSTLLSEGTPGITLVPNFNTTLQHAVYSFWHAANDKGYTAVRGKSAIFLMPRQSMQIEFEIKGHQKSNELVFEYILLFDFCYRSFLDQVEQNGYWWRNYAMREKRFNLDEAPSMK